MFSGSVNKRESARCHISTTDSYRWTTVTALDNSTVQVAEFKSSYNRHLVIIPEPQFILTTLGYNPLHRESWKPTSPWREGWELSSPFLLIRIFNNCTLFGPHNGVMKKVRQMLLSLSLRRGFWKDKDLVQVTVLQSGGICPQAQVFWFPGWDFPLQYVTGTDFTNNHHHR